MSKGAEVLARATTHWRDRLVAPMKEVAVPEWGAVIYFQPSTLAQRNRIYRYLNDGSLEGLAEMVVIRALDDEGNRMFNNADKKAFMSKVDPDVLIRVVDAMNEEPETTMEDARKNSDTATKKSS